MEKTSINWYSTEEVEVLTSEDVATTKFYTEYTIHTSLELDGSSQGELKNFYFTDEQLKRTNYPRIFIGSATKGNEMMEQNIPVLQILQSEETAYSQRDIYKFAKEVATDYERIEATWFMYRTKEEMMKEVAKKYNLNYVKKD